MSLYLASLIRLHTTEGQTTSRYIQATCFLFEIGVGVVFDDMEAGMFRVSVELWICVKSDFDTDL